MAEMIRVAGLHKRFQLGTAQVHALRGVDLTVAEGEVVVLGGPSGSGKSTLLHLVGGLDQPTQGTVSIAGRRLERAGDDELSAFRARRIGFVFQNFNLLPVLNVAENVEYPLLLGRTGQRRARVRQVLEQVGLAECERQRPGELSGGQRQRVAIARALVHRPALLIADEPTANLDSDTGAQVMDLMLALSREQGSTVVICTHDTGYQAGADRLVMLRDGQVSSDSAGQSTARRAAAV